MTYRIKLGFSNISVDGLLTKANQITTSMTGNVNFPTPTPAIADIETAVDELAAAASDALNRDKLKIVIRNEKKQALMNLLRILAFYVNSVNNTNRGIMESSGFDVISRGEPIGVLPQPQGLRVTTEEGFSGMLKLEWNAVHGASSYIAEMATSEPTNPATEWEEIGHPQKTRFFAEGLTPGANYWFRVIPVGAAGLGGVSSAIGRMAA